MNLIQYLQQGGFILPQYTQSNLSYEVPQAGNQAIDRMNQYAQQDMQNYIGLENLNISRKQADTSYFNSMIQNKLAIEREDRINKQTDLNNKKLELDQFKAINSMLDEEMKFDKDNFLNRDRAALDKLYKDQGADMETLLKNPNDLNSLSKGLSLRKQIKMAYKTGWDNKLAVEEASAMLAQSEKYEKYLNDLEAKGIPIDINAKLAFTEGRRNAYNEMVGFKQGKVAKMDLQGGHWQTIAAMPDFINEVEQKIQTDLERQTQTIENNVRLLNAETNQSTALVNKARAERILQNLPVEILESTIKSVGAVAKYAPTLSVLSEALPGVNLNDPTNILTALSNATPKQLEKITKELEKADQATKDHHYGSLQALYADCIANGCSPEKIAQIEKALSAVNTSRHYANHNSTGGNSMAGSNEQGVSISKNVTSYGTWNENINTGEITGLKVGNTTYDSSININKYEGVEVVKEDLSDGTEGPVIKVNYATEGGKAFMFKRIGKQLEKETNEDYAKRFARRILREQGVPQNEIEKYVKAAMNVSGVVKVFRNKSKSSAPAQSSSSGAAYPGW